MFFQLCCFGLLALSHAYVNVAFNKPTYQEFTYNYDRFKSSKAVDGRKSDLSVNGDECAVSHNGQNATWWVNLTSINSIHYITIYFMTNNKSLDTANSLTRYIPGFLVYVSNTTDISLKTICFNDSNYINSTIPDVINITCQVLGQYVIIYNERLPGVTYPDGYSAQAFNLLCEVEVYGYCPVGYFGAGCAENCNTTCDGCNTVNGLCDSGCHPGWKGFNCEEKGTCITIGCDNNVYGPACKRSCGNCLNRKDCYHINGSCLSGCKAGYKGEKCMDVCDYGFHGLQCLKECSKFCKTTQDCHPVTGTCHGGCRSGWRGHDCLEVSTYQSQFIGVLVAFCIVLGASTAYFTMKRIKKYKEKQHVKNQSKASPKQRQDEQPNVYTNETLDIDYQELGELKKPEIYDTVQQ